MAPTQHNARQGSRNRSTGPATNSNSNRRYRPHHPSHHENINRSLHQQGSTLRSVVDGSIVPEPNQIFPVDREPRQEYYRNRFYGSTERRLQHPIYATINKEDVYTSVRGFFI